MFVFFHFWYYVRWGLKVHVLVLHSCDITCISNWMNMTGSLVVAQVWLRYQGYILHLWMQQLSSSRANLSSALMKGEFYSLIFFVREGHVETTQLLLSRGAEINKPSGSNDDTPLTLACWKGTTHFQVYMYTIYGMNVCNISVTKLFTCFNEKANILEIWYSQMSPCIILAIFQRAKRQCFKFFSEPLYIFWPFLQCLEFNVHKYEFSSTFSLTSHAPNPIQVIIVVLYRPCRCGWLAAQTQLKSWSSDQNRMYPAHGSHQASCN